MFPIILLKVEESTSVGFRVISAKVLVKNSDSGQNVRTDQTCVEITIERIVDADNPSLTKSEFLLTVRIKIAHAIRANSEPLG